MPRQSKRAIAGAVLMMTGVCAFAPSAPAQDFLSSLFGGFAVRRPPPPVAPSSPFVYSPAEAPRPRVASSGQTWCVRTCDGRYFPAQGTDRQSRAASCNSFCPAASTELVSGSDIDDATTESGKAYSELPNAFRYRSEIVAGCTCNGKDQVGLAPVPVEKDPTLRKGDIVAGEGGLMVTARSPNKHAAANFSPVPDGVRARYRHAPVMAAE